MSAPTLAGVFFPPDPQPREGLALVAPERDWNGWVSASRTCNFFLRDPLLDWLEVYGEQNGFVRDDALPSFDARTDFARFIINKGYAFELAVMTLLRSRCEVVSSSQARGDSRDPRKAQEIIAAMKAGVEMIYQGVCCLRRSLG